MKESLDSLNNKFRLPECHIIHPLKIISLIHKKMFKNGAERVDREERQRTHDENHADKDNDKQRPGRRKSRAAFGHDLFFRERARHCERRNYRRETADKHGHCECSIVKYGIHV